LGRCCKKLHIDFSDRTRVITDERLTVFRYDSVGNRAMTLVGRITMKDLELHGIDLPNAAGFMMRYERPPNTTLGWGFRLTKIICSSEERIVLGRTLVRAPPAFSPTARELEVTRGARQTDGAIPSSQVPPGRKRVGSAAPAASWGSC